MTVRVKVVLNSQKATIMKKRAMIKTVTSLGKMVQAFKRYKIRRTL